MGRPTTSRRPVVAAVLCQVALATMVLVAQPSSAAPQRLVLDPEQTDISFTLGATAHTVEGKLFLRSGILTFDPDIGAASGELLIDAVRTNTANDRRDKKMHAKVLLSERFPEMRFVAESINGTIANSGSSSFEVVGTLELLGKTHRFTLPIAATIEGQAVAATSSFAVPYVEFGLKDPSVLVLRVEKHVDVKVDASGSLTALEN